MVNTEKLIAQTIQYVIDKHIETGDAIYRFYLVNSRPILEAIHAFFKSMFDVILLMTILLATGYLIMSLITSMKRKEKEKTIKKGKEPFVTVQIPTYNELAAIACAKKCLEFDYPKEKVQIIIGDDSKDKKVSARIDSFAAEYPGRILVTRRGNNKGFKPGNLNNMLKYTKGKHIVIFDSDFLPDKDFLRRIIAPLENDDTLSVSQARWKIENYNQNIFSVLGGTITLLCHNIGMEFINLVGGNGFLLGSAEAIRKKDLEMVGGWKNGSLTEDIECSLRLLAKGKKLKYVETLSCACEAPHTFKDLNKQQMRWSFGVISSLKEHFKEIFYRNNIKIKDKMSIMILVSGYLFTFMLLGLTLFGNLSVISNAPAPINWAKFLRETGINIIFTSGFIIASGIALWKSKLSKSIPKMITSSISIGLVVSYYVNLGILKAITGQKITWFMLKKNGNKVRN